MKVIMNSCRSVNNNGMMMGTSSGGNSNTTTTAFVLGGVLPPTPGGGRTMIGYNGKVIGWKHEDASPPQRNNNVRSTAECDSTTADNNSFQQQQQLQMQQRSSAASALLTSFQIDEDVYYQDETGKNVLGTVELIQGKKIKIQFMDGTEKWAPLSRVKKISFNNFDGEDQDSAACVVVPPPPPPDTSAGGAAIILGGKGNNNNKKKQDLNKESCQVTCGSCGTQKMITAKKAVEFSPFTSHQYNCRKCINKSKTSKNSGGVPLIAAQYFAAVGSVRGRPRLNNNSSNDHNNSANSNGGGTSSSLMGAHSKDANGYGHGGNSNNYGGGVGGGGTDSSSSSEQHQQQSVCLHCRSTIMEKVSLHCTMCERACHPSCLTLTPPPMPGDIFWSIICHVCGTQKPDGAPENDTQKLYSSRRSITCWSDVAYLLLSCMGCRNGGGGSSNTNKFFDLDKEVIPFWADNLARLHLPRQYKQADPLERRRCLLVALNNANLRFTRDDSTTTGDSLAFAIKDNRYLLNNNNQRTALTAAGFPISVRATNPEATSAAMSNIVQTIAVQNKSSVVPSPKNSPNGSAILLQKSTTTTTAKTLARVKQVAKKSGSEMNFGHTTTTTLPQQQQQQPKKPDQIWPTSRYGKVQFLSEPPPLLHKSDQSHNKTTTTTTTKTLTPSPGGSARVSGIQSAFMMMSPNNNSNDVTNNRFSANTTTTTSTTNGSFPVRKNGSPVMSRSLKVEAVKNKLSSSNGEGGGDHHLAFSRSNVNVKRKILPDPQQQNQPSKKLKLMTLPSSTDVSTTSSSTTSPPPQIRVDTNTTPTKVRNDKSSMSPLQKLSDLQKNGGLTVACVRHTEGGLVQTSVAIPSSSSSSSSSGYDSVLATPVDNATSVAKDLKKPVKVEQKAAVIVIPAAAVVAGGGGRPVRLKRSVVVSNAAKKEKEEVLNKGKNSNKKNQQQQVAASKLVAKSRGRPKNKLLRLRKFEPQPQPTVVEANSVESANSNFSFQTATVQDLVRYGVGYRLEVLPKDCSDAAAIEHFREELAPRPPSYWSSGGGNNKKCSRRDLKDLDSYYLNARRVDKDGNVAYQVVWRDGFGYECDSDNEEDVREGGEYLDFEDCDQVEFFMDCVPVVERDGGAVEGGNVDEEMEEEEDDEVVIEEEPESTSSEKKSNKKQSGGGGDIMDPDVIDLTDSP